MTKTRKIFVGGLSAPTTTDDIRRYFESYGPVTEAVLMIDKQTQRHRGFGFITFENEDIAEQVCQKPFHEINNKMVECKKALPKELMLPSSKGSLALPQAFLTACNRGYTVASLPGYYYHTGLGGYAILPAALPSAAFPQLDRYNSLTTTPYYQPEYTIIGTSTAYAGTTVGQPRVDSATRLMDGQQVVSQQGVAVAQRIMPSPTEQNRGVLSLQKFPTPGADLVIGVPGTNGFSINPAFLQGNQLPPYLSQTDNSAYIQHAVSPPSLAPYQGQFVAPAFHSVYH